MLPPVSSVRPPALWMGSLYSGDFLGSRGEGELCPSLGLQLLFHCLFMSLQQSFFLLDNCMSQMQAFGEKVLCSHWRGCSQLPCHGLMVTGERGAVHLCVPESPARRWSGSWVQKVLYQLANVILKVILTSPSDNCSY